MALVIRIKDLLQDMAFPLGVALSRVPYSWRPAIGKAYSMRKAEAKTFDAMSLAKQKQLILERVRGTIAHASSEIPFYRDIYAQAGFRIGDLKSFDDIQRIPIITKEQLKETDLEARSSRCPGRYMTNTGGSTGSPLHFYITPEHIPAEWAHMHTIWESAGYRQSALLLTFKGRNLRDRCLAYDGLRHQYSVNVYMDMAKVAPALLDLLKRRRVQYLHGYPSALYEFAHFCEEHCRELRDRLRETLKGALLSSEFPVSEHRAVIERVFSIPTLSWYGHSERAILAWEKREPFVYEPFQTYGYCEAVEDKQTGRWRLIGTSYFNHASPFIRYDTGDDIEPVEFESGVLRSFRIREGRVGDFVVDRHGVRIPLTALVFGRHHELFNLAKFLQVRQEERGRITVLVTPKNGLPEGFDFTKWFDASGLAMDIAFQVLESPILTPAGKVALKVSSLQGTADSPQVRGDVYETSVLFNAKARTWNQKYQPGGALASRVNAFSEHLVRSLAPNDKILDLGCGTGAIAVELVARGFRIAACDVAEQMIEVGKQIYSECPIEWFLLPSDWKRLPFESNTFGGIVASSVLEYVSDVNMVLAECQRALKPGGLLLATVPDSHKLIRRLENFLRPAAILAVRMSILDRIPILLSYTTYLKCSRNRMPLDEWFAIGKQAGFEVVEEIRSRASKTALIFLVFRKTDSNS